MHKSLKEYAQALKELAQEHQIYVVVGGGRIAREYIEKARALGASEMFCDQIGIGATKLNSALLVAALGASAPQEIPDSYAGAARLAKPGRIVVMGGVAVGQTTDAVAALLAEYVRADRLIVATSVDGVYTADPEKDPDAKKLGAHDASRRAGPPGHGDGDEGRLALARGSAGRQDHREKLHSHGHSAGQQNRKFEKRRPGWAHGNGNQAGVSVLTRSLGETMPHRAPCSDTISWLAPVRPSILMAS